MLLRDNYRSKFLSNLPFNNITGLHSQPLSPRSPSYTGNSHYRGNTNYGYAVSTQLSKLPSGSGVVIRGWASVLGNTGWVTHFSFPPLKIRILSYFPLPPSFYFTYTKDRTFFKKIISRTGARGHLTDPYFRLGGRSDLLSVCLWYLH